MNTQRPNQALQPTRADRFSSASRFTRSDPAWLSLGLWADSRYGQEQGSNRTVRVRRSAMKDDSIRVLKTVKYSAIAVSVLMVAGILTVMVLARGKTGDDGDIAGVVAPALLLTCVSGVVAAVAAVRQKRAQHSTHH